MSPGNLTSSSSLLGQELSTSSPPCKMILAMASPSSSSPVKLPLQLSDLTRSKRSTSLLDSPEESTKRSRSLPQNVLDPPWLISPRVQPPVSSAHPSSSRLSPLGLPRNPLQPKDEVLIYVLVIKQAADMINGASGRPFTQGTASCPFRSVLPTSLSF